MTLDVATPDVEPSRRASVQTQVELRRAVFRETRLALESDSKWQINEGSAFNRLQHAASAVLKATHRVSVRNSVVGAFRSAVEEKRREQELQKANDAEAFAKCLIPASPTSDKTESRTVTMEKLDLVLDRIESMQSLPEMVRDQVVDKLLMQFEVLLSTIDNSDASGIDGIVCTLESLIHDQVSRLVHLHDSSSSSLNACDGLSEQFAEQALKAQRLRDRMAADLPALQALLARAAEERARDAINAVVEKDRVSTKKDVQGSAGKHRSLAPVVEHSLHYLGVLKNALSTSAQGGEDCSYDDFRDQLLSILKDGANYDRLVEWKDSLATLVVNSESRPLANAGMRACRDNASTFMDNANTFERQLSKSSSAFSGLGSESDAGDDAPTLVTSEVLKSNLATKQAERRAITLESCEDGDQDDSGGQDSEEEAMHATQTTLSTLSHAVQPACADRIERAKEGGKIISKVIDGLLTKTSMIPGVSSSSDDNGFIAFGATPSNPTGSRLGAVEAYVHSEVLHLGQHHHAIDDSTIDPDDVDWDGQISWANTLTVDAMKAERARKKTLVAQEDDEDTLAGTIGGSVDAGNTEVKTEAVGPFPKKPAHDHVRYLRRRSNDMAGVTMESLYDFERKLLSDVLAEGGVEKLRVDTHVFYHMPGHRKPAGRRTLSLRAGISEAEDDTSKDKTKSPRRQLLQFDSTTRSS